MLNDLRELRTGARELRKFGLLVGGVLAALGLVMWARGRVYFPWFLAPGAVLAALGLALPKVLKPVYVGWMALALALGFVVSQVILTAFFFLVITPIGLAARMLGKDFLRLRLDRQAGSYWMPRQQGGPKPPKEYEQQF